MITYSPVKKTLVVKTIGEKRCVSICNVSLEDKIVGQIYRCRSLNSKPQDLDKLDTFIYIPKGKKTGGDEFTSLAACQRSLLS